MSGYRRFWRFGALAAGIAAASAVLTGQALPGGAREAAVAPLPPEALPYSPQSLLRRPIAAKPRIDPRCAAIIRRLTENARQSKVTINTGGASPTVYRAKAGDPFYRVRVGGQDVRFRVPDYAQPGQGPDYPLVVLDRNHPEFGPYVELRLYGASIDHGSRDISSSGAGLFRYDAKGTGRPFLGFGTGSGLSTLAGLIRPREVANGRIDHAIRFAYSSQDFIRSYRAPATKTDQPRSGPVDPGGAMEMGMRLQLDPRVNCERRTVPGRAPSGKETRFLRMLCRALQTHGMVVLDGTGPTGILLQMENAGTAPWERLIGPENNGNYGFIIRDQTTPRDGLQRDSTSGIPWNRMRVLAR